MNKPKHTPWLLILIGCGFLALTAWSVYQAKQGTSDVTDRDYYSHGLRYNETLLERKAAESLGWSTQTVLQGHRITVLLMDAGKRPVTQARGKLTMMAPGGLDLKEYLLEEHSAGRYSAELPAELKGEHSLALVFERAGARLNKRILLTLK